MKLHEIAELQAKQQEKRIIFSASKAHSGCRLLFSEFTDCIIYANSGKEYIIDIYDLIRDDWKIMENKKKSNAKGEL